jgi:CheY-like chemotaxis protein
MRVVDQAQAIRRPSPTSPASPQTLARRLLERRGHTIVVANNGREALAILEEVTSAGFDLVPLDVQMPEMGGFECTAINDLVSQRCHGLV